MKFKQYKYPKEVGWLGWIENCKGNCVAFIQLDGLLIFEW